MLKKWVGFAVVVSLLGGLSAVIYAVSNNKVVVGYNKGYMPDQPIPFSHELHAGQYKMDCRYCHTSVEVSRHASVPSLNICMNCHLVVKVDSPWIQKMAEAYNKGEPIAWQKVHLLPDHVKFNHAPHIRAGVDCTSCHGPVQTMEVVYQYSSLSMGWCVNCHREGVNSEVKTDYDPALRVSMPDPHEKMKAPPRAPVDCNTCHY